MVNSIVRVIAAVFAALCLAAFSCSTNFSSSPLPPETGPLPLSDCPTQSLEISDNSGLVDWFSGQVEVPYDDDVLGIRLVELNPVYSIPGDADLNFFKIGGWDLEFILELRNSTGACVLSKPFLISDDRFEYRRWQSEFEPFIEFFSTRVASPPDYTSFAIKLGNRELAVAERSAHTPTVSIQGIPQDQGFEENEPVSISWVGHDQDGDQLTYRVFRSYEAGGDWYERTSSNFEGTQWNFFNFKSTDDAGVAVAVSDGTRSTFSIAPAFRVSEHDPEVKIVRPVAGTVYYEQQQIPLRASSRDYDWSSIDRDAHVWSSSIDGHLGIGKSIDMTADQLTLGGHIITVIATDETGRTGTDSIPVTIQATQQNAEPGLMHRFSGVVRVPRNSDDITVITLLELDSVYSLPKKTRSAREIYRPQDFGFELELRNSTGASIRNIPFNISTVPSHADPSLISGDYFPVTESFEVKVPDPPKYASFAIKAGSRELAVIERSAHTPTVTIEDIFENQVFKENEPFSISWQGHDQDGDTLTYRIFKSYDAGQTWLEDTNIYYDLEATQWDYIRFQATDQARIAVAASDGIRSTFAMTPIFQVKP